MSDKKELQRIIENITSTYNCFENDRCCNKTESEETEAELDEIIQFINNQDKQLQACQEQVTTKTDEFGNKYLEWEKTFLENTALKQQLDTAVEAFWNIYKTAPRACSAIYSTCGDRKLKCKDAEHCKAIDIAKTALDKVNYSKD